MKCLARKGNQAQVGKTTAYALFVSTFKGKIVLVTGEKGAQKTRMRIQIELGEMASVIINEMGRRCYQHGVCAVNPIEAIARICVETTVAQAIDNFIDKDGGDWLLEGANDPDRACKRIWDDLEEPGDYVFALKQHGLSPKRSISARRRKLRKTAARSLKKPEDELTISDLLNFNERERGL